VKHAANGCALPLPHVLVGARASLCGYMGSDLNYVRKAPTKAANLTLHKLVAGRSIRIEQITRQRGAHMPCIFVVIQPSLIDQVPLGIQRRCGGSSHQTAPSLVKEDPSRTKSSWATSISALLGIEPSPAVACRIAGE